MLLYWVLFAYFAFGALGTIRMAVSPTGESAHRRTEEPGPLFLMGALCVIAFLGLRYEVGADWDSYVFMYRDAGRHEFFENLFRGDPAYQALNWISFQAGGEVLLVNLACACIFAWGLFKFAATQPAPWAALLVAIPYMVIVVAMGYTRQGVALGLLMAGLASFVRGGSLIRFAAYVFIAALFHRTAVVAFPLVALAMPRNRFLNLLLVTALSLVLYDVFIADQLGNYVDLYVQARYSSQGAAIRIAMNIIPAAVFWIFGRRLNFSVVEYSLWRNFSLAALALAVLLVVLPSSAAVDRLSLYVMPLQIGVLSRLAMISDSKIFGTTILVGYALLVQFVWFNFAHHARYWVPYQFFPM